MSGKVPTGGGQPGSTHRLAAHTALTAHITCQGSGRRLDVTNNMAAKWRLRIPICGRG